MAIKENNRVMMISDGRIYGAEESYCVDSRNNYKVQKYGTLFVGMSGNSLSVQFLNQTFDFNKLKNFTIQKFYEIFWKYVVDNIDRFPSAKLENGAVDNLGVSFIFVEKQRIFTTDFDEFGLLECSSFFSIGKDSDSIAGAYISLLENHSVYDAAIKAFQYIFKVSNYSGYPLYIWYSDSNQVTIIKNSGLEEIKEPVFYNRPMKGIK